MNTISLHLSSNLFRKRANLNTDGIKPISCISLTLPNLNTNGNQTNLLHSSVTFPNLSTNGTQTNLLHQYSRLGKEKTFVFRKRARIPAGIVSRYFQSSGSKRHATEKLVPN